MIGKSRLTAHLAALPQDDGPRNSHLSGQNATISDLAVVAHLDLSIQVAIRTDPGW